MSTPKAPIDPGTIERRPDSPHGRVYRVSSRSTSGGYYDVLHEPTTGRLRCPCPAGVHRGACAHAAAVRALLTDEAARDLDGMSLSDLADLDRHYQRRVEAGDHLSTDEQIRWQLVAEAWMTARYGPSAA